MVITLNYPAINNVSNKCFDSRFYFSMSPLRQRKVSESCLDTTSVGRVRTHSGCNPNMSPFHSPFSPPMNSYQMQPQLYHSSQENNISTITSEKRSESKESEVNKSNHSEVSKETKQSGS